MKLWRCYIDPETGLTDVQSLGSEDELETFEVVEYSEYEAIKTANPDAWNNVWLREKIEILTKERDEARAAHARLQSFIDKAKAEYAKDSEE
jgi:trehalose/maltose hydrolase-like predicted phosphorylase